MKAPKDCTNMTEIREAIDITDRKIVKLIAERYEYVKEAAKFKIDEKAVKDPQRVLEVLRSKKELAIKYGAPPELTEQIYKMMINFFIGEEMKEWKSNP